MGQLLTGLTAEIKNSALVREILLMGQPSMVMGLEISSLVLIWVIKPNQNGVYLTVLIMLELLLLPPLVFLWGTRRRRSGNV